MNVKSRLGMMDGKSGGKSASVSRAAALADQATGQNRKSVSTASAPSSAMSI